MKSLASSLPALLALATVATLGSPAPAAAAVAYSLADDGLTLVSFDTGSPGAVSVIGAISGATTRLRGMDFRPADGMLYGYSASSAGIYRIDTATGVTTLVSTSTVMTTDPLAGIDFNPVPDRLRVVNTDNDNLRINVATGATITDGSLAYAGGDANAGANPFVVDVAYTNHDRNPATLTTLYYIDALLDALVTTTNPNAGLLSTVGALGVAVDEFTGFDIFTEVGVNTAYASFTNANGQASLYTVDLATGSASLIGDIGARGLYGLAVTPVPIGPSWTLLLAGGLAGVVVRARRRQGAAMHT